VTVMLGCLLSECVTSVHGLQALENTLVQLVGVNSAFSQTFKKADTTSSTQERLELRYADTTLRLHP
jgi:hypothetical protein